MKKAWIFVLLILFISFSFAEIGEQKQEKNQEKVEAPISGFFAEAVTHRMNEDQVKPNLMIKLFRDTGAYHNVQAHYSLWMVVPDEVIKAEAKYDKWQDKYPDYALIDAIALVGKGYRIKDIRVIVREESKMGRERYSGTWWKDWPYGMFTVHCPLLQRICG